MTAFDTPEEMHEELGHLVWAEALTDGDVTLAGEVDQLEQRGYRGEAVIVFLPEPGQPRPDSVPPEDWQDDDGEVFAHLDPDIWREAK